ncbi:hypothetical protein COOONC_22514 [Cooperia oncophora]
MESRLHGAYMFFDHLWDHFCHLSLCSQQIATTEFRKSREIFRCPARLYSARTCAWLFLWHFRCSTVDISATISIGYSSTRRSEQARMYRRNILRYCELVQVSCYPMKKRYSSHTMAPRRNIGYQANWALAMTYQAWKHGHIESAYYKVTLQEVRNVEQRITPKELKIGQLVHFS